MHVESLTQIASSAHAFFSLLALALAHRSSRSHLRVTHIRCWSCTLVHSGNMIHVCNRLTRLVDVQSACTAHTGALINILAAAAVLPARRTQRAITLITHCGEPTPPPLLLPLRADCIVLSCFCVLLSRANVFSALSQQRQRPAGC
jgi:hypothetical protein